MKEKECDDDYKELSWDLRIKQVKEKECDDDSIQLSSVLEGEVEFFAEELNITHAKILTVLSDLYMNFLYTSNIDCSEFKNEIDKILLITKEMYLLEKQLMKTDGDGND